MPLLPSLVVNPAIPWRLRNGLQRWVETRCRVGTPRLYRWLHFGHARDAVEPVTRGPAHHFFGYYDKSPWNASGSLILAHEAGFNDRPPQADDPVTIGVIREDCGNRFDALAVSQAWNWQQGAMLQWHPAEPDRLFFHNDCRRHAHVAVLRSSDGREIREYERPVYALMPDGRHAISLNFARLQTHRPGYGYPGAADPWAQETAPAADGLHRLDLETGTSRLIVSLAELAALNPKEAMRGAPHYVNHVQPSPGGKRIAFFHIWRTGDAGWEVRLYTVDPDGRGLRCVLDTGKVSHYDWLDDARILVWARAPGGRERFLLCDETGGSHEVVGDDALTEDGHCSFSPDRKWILNDTYPDRFDMRTLMLVRFADRKRIDIARLHSPKARWWGEIRCDLHPRWSRDGQRVCIDSVHDGTRQMYVMDVTRWVG